MSSNESEANSYEESSQEEYVASVKSCRRIKNSRKAKRPKKCLRDSPLGASGHFEVFSSIMTSPDTALLSDTKELLLSLSMSQKDLADQLGVSQTKISQYLNGGSRMRGWKGMEDALTIWVSSNQQLNSDVASPCNSSDSVPESVEDCSETQSCNSDSDSAPQELEFASLLDTEPICNFSDTTLTSYFTNEYSQEDSWSSFSIMAIYGQ